MKSISYNEIPNVKFGPWTFYPKFGRFLNHNGKEFFIDNRLNKLLTLLIERNGSIVERDELIENVWNEVQVNEENLTKGIFDLRKLLKENEITEIEITTIRNVGYRLQINNRETKSKKITRRLLKSAVYFIFIISFVIMFIRAIRYEN